MNAVPYTSTDCRIGNHAECKHRRIVPNCPCPCHQAVQQVTIVYFDGCPNWQTGRERLVQAIADADLTGMVEVSYRQMHTPEEAERIGYLGSPTFLFDGHDPWASDGGPGGLSCRIYRTDDRREGCPSVDQLRDALRPG